VRPAPYGEIEKFCQIDGWSQIRSGGQGRRGRQRHVKYEKVLADGQVLRTQVSHDRRSSPSPGRWAGILRNQLRVTEDQFWNALASQKEVDRRPPPPPPAPIPVADWVRGGLRRRGLSDQQIDDLGPEAAQQELQRRWRKE
jgi:hypothetical protein